jgi:hypothetical protein
MTDVLFSTNLSIFIQIVTGLISARGIFIPLTSKHAVLRDILILETFVQIVELFFYFFFLRSMASSNATLQQMAATRYFDWAITTPTMLLTTIIFFKYQEYLEKEKDKQGKILTFWDFIKDNKKNIILIFVSNFLMLVFGYLGEIKAINMGTSLVFGFGFFAYTFYIIYSQYAINSTQSLKLFYFILFIWGLYGVAALFNVVPKNHAFNALDIFAKNFFGLYLYFKILSIKNK